jgi:glyoxylase-like metal-dependent hydrolase (beta-lactamase superfamily II)
MGESSAARLGAEPGAAQRSLRAFDDEHYIDGRPPLRLGGVQALPVPGRLSLGGENGGENGGEGERELELHPAAGHTADGTAYLLPWLGTLVCGDYLSPVEIPMLSAGGSIDAYLGTLMTLGGLLDRVETVVPGHGGPQPRERAERILEQDVAYLETLRDTGDAPLPAGRGSAEQRRIHDRNVARLGSG